MQDLLIRNVKISQLSGKTYAWFTLEPSTASVTPRLMTNIKKVEAVVKGFMDVNYGYDEDELDEVQMIKLDTAQDLHGAFIPTWNSKTFKSIKSRL